MDIPHIVWKPQSQYYKPICESDIGWPTNGV